MRTTWLHFLMLSEQSQRNKSRRDREQEESMFRVIVVFMDKIQPNKVQQSPTEPIKGPGLKSGEIRT